MDFDNWFRVEVDGFSGGLWLFWNSEIHIHVIKSHPQFIHMEIETNGQDNWLFTLIYGSPSPQLRKFLWSELSSKKLNLNSPWMLAGDFNVVVSMDEVSNPNNFRHRSNSQFSQWLFDEALIDLGYQGDRLT